METISIQELTNLACVRYGQLVTPIDVYQLTQDAQELLLKDVVEEYSHYIPMKKVIEVTATPSGVFLGNDVISVRNVRMNNFYFSELSPRMKRRQKKFDAHTKMLYMPMSLPVVVECGVMYPVGRISISDKVDTVLSGDTYVKFKLNNFRQGTVKIQIGSYSWNDIDTDYEADTIYLDGDNNASDMADVTYDKESKTFSITDIDELNIVGETPVLVKYNTDSAVVQGLGLRDKLFVDLFIGRLMLALGNIKTQIVMDGDVIGFANEDLITQGQDLVDKTLELLMSSSTSYMII